MAPKQATSTPQPAAGRTSDRIRRPSREALEAVVTNADVRDVMGTAIGTNSSLGPHIAPPSSTGTVSSNVTSSSSSSSSSPSANGMALLSQLSQADIHDLMTAVAQFRASPQSSSSSSTATAVEKKVIAASPTMTGGASTPSVHHPHPISSRMPIVTTSNIDSDISDDDDADELVTAHDASNSETAVDSADLVWDMMVIPAGERMAANAVALCQRDYGTFRRRAMEKKCSDRRNAREIDVLSLIFDALIADRNDVAMELVARRIVGIEEADSSGNWHIADAIQVMRAGSLMSEQHRRHFVKVAKLLDKDRRDSGSGIKRTTPRTSAKKAARRNNTKQSNTARASSTTSAAGKD